VGKQLDFDYLAKASSAATWSRTNGNGAQKVAFLGELGTFSHKACIQYFGEKMAVEFKPSFRAIFEAVKSGEVKYGVVPLENSLSGSIHENYDLLLEYDLTIVGEITLRIIHHLIGRPGATFEKIRRVASAEPAVQQCRQFLECYPDWQIVTVNATASAVREISCCEDQSFAAIGSKEAADLYGMAVIEAGIETDPRNFTRFAVIAAEPGDKSECKKSSLVYSVGNQPGALFETLKIFQENKINLVKLESRPIHGRPWQYMFYADLEADVAAERFAPILAALHSKTEFLKILGRY
jgi:3-deoxy-7-phosphoheptulonate synthase